jgi:hypothetical protein
MTEETNPQEVQQEAAPAEAPNLTVQDLAGLKAIVDVAAQRGAFKPAEMAAVGAIYNKLTAFLETITKDAPQNG